MLQPTYTLGEQRLLEAADLVEHSRTYRQDIFTWPKWEEPHTDRFPCRTPACVLGHYAVAHPEDWVITNDGIPLLRAIPPKPTDLYPFIVPTRWLDYFGLSSHRQWQAIFGLVGCGGAKTGAQAAAFIRGFVAQRFADRLAKQPA